jgi:hypothetical protein
MVLLTADSRVLDSSHLMKRGNQFPFIKVWSITGTRSGSQTLELTISDSCQSQSPERTRPGTPSCMLCLEERLAGTVSLAFVHSGEWPGGITVLPMSRAWGAQPAPKAVGLDSDK